jgi:hypothetical protein
MNTIVDLSLAGNLLTNWATGSFSRCRTVSFSSCPYLILLIFLFQVSCHLLIRFRVQPRTVPVFRCTLARYCCCYCGSTAVTTITVTTTAGSYSDTEFLELWDKHWCSEREWKPPPQSHCAGVMDHTVFCSFQRLTCAVT